MVSLRSSLVLYHKKHFLLTVWDTPYTLAESYMVPLYGTEVSNYLIEYHPSPRSTMISSTSAKLGSKKTFDSVGLRVSESHFDYMRY